MTLCVEHYLIMITVTQLIFGRKDFDQYFGIIDIVGDRDTVCFVVYARKF